MGRAAQEKPLAATPERRGAVEALTLYLGAGDPSVQALAGVAVIVPLGPIWYHTPHSDARPP